MMYAMNAFFCRLLGVLLLAVAMQSWLAAQDADPYEVAIQKATEKVLPSLVRIETLGGLDKVGAVLVGTGPTTGMIVDPQGYIISSAMNFAQNPTQIVTYLADGSRHPAKLIAEDESHRLVLLKIETDKPLPVATAADMKSVKVGQGVIALGRAFESDKPNLSVGIVSALNRIWGKAIQTDAKISPNNYGGPLIDLSGKVLGILTPLSPHANGDDAGVEWYDSGIGFAVPLENVNRVLSRLKKGENLVPGLLGISLRGQDIYADAVVIAAIQPNSPASKAGWKPGDKVVQVAGQTITRQAQLKHALGPYYAGEKVTVKLLRGSEEIENEVTLIGKLAPSPHPFLGVLPAREAEGKPGVGIRGLYNGSPAIKAGIEPTDRIIAIDDKPITDKASLLEQLNTMAVDREVSIKVQRGGAEKTLTTKLAKLPESLPSSLPPARGVFSAPEGEAPATGAITIKIPEVKNECTAFVPKTYQANVPHALVILLSAPGPVQAGFVIPNWEAACEKHDLILLMPQSADAAKWERGEVDFVRKATDDVLKRYNIDRQRVVIIGQDGGGALAWLMTFQQRDLIRGVATLNTMLPSGLKIPANDPVLRLATLIAGPDQGPAAAKFMPLVKSFRDQFYPVTALPMNEASLGFGAEQIQQLATWIDSLDRL
jgi:serine protease Do